jgi:hypothetical protein
LADQVRWRAKDGTDLPAAEIRYRMGSRWRQENHYRYARLHFDFDSHDTYSCGDDDP